MLGVNLVTFEGEFGSTGDSRSAGTHGHARPEGQQGISSYTLCEC